MNKYRLGTLFGVPVMARRVYAGNRLFYLDGSIVRKGSNEEPIFGEDILSGYISTKTYTITVPAGETTESLCDIDWDKYYPLVMINWPSDITEEDKTFIKNSIKCSEATLDNGIWWIDADELYFANSANQDITILCTLALIPLNLVTSSKTIIIPVSPDEEAIIVPYTSTIDIPQAENDSTPSKSELIHLGEFKDTYEININNVINTITSTSAGTGILSVLYGYDKETITNTSLISLDNKAEIKGNANKNIYLLFSNTTKSPILVTSTIKKMESKITLPLEYTFTLEEDKTGFINLKNIDKFNIQLKSLTYAGNDQLQVQGSYLKFSYMKSNSDTYTIFSGSTFPVDSDFKHTNVEGYSEGNTYLIFSNTTGTMTATIEITEA